MPKIELLDVEDTVPLTACERKEKKLEYEQHRTPFLY